MFVSVSPSVLVHTKTNKRLTNLYPYIALYPLNKRKNAHTSYSTFPFIDIHITHDHTLHTRPKISSIYTRPRMSTSINMPIILQSSINIKSPHQVSTTPHTHQ